MSNYAKHASIWDWSGYDRSPVFEFWYKLAKSYGDSVLSVMSAIGEVGAYLAERGLSVTALDYTAEMIIEGQKRFSHLQNLNFIQADARNYNLHCSYDFAFIGSTDLHHMLNIADVKSVLQTIKKHLRDKGGLGLELWYASDKSWQFQKRRFEPLVINEKQKVWKQGSTSYNANTKLVKICQEVFIEKHNKTECFTHDFEMQLYSRELLIQTLIECGFKITAEYGNYNFEQWNENSNKWLLELKSI